MARTIKQGLDYFPLDVDMDDNFELIEAKHGITGFGIVVKLFQKIYKEGYYFKCNEETLLLFAKRNNVNINSIHDVINDCIKYNIFDKELYKEHGVLTSNGIQKRYFEATRRRKQIELEQNLIIADINEIDVNINWINTYKSTQSKVKESKVNKSKEKQIPTYKEFFDYVIANIPNIDKHHLELKYKSWVQNDWKDGNDKPIKNWKSKALNACGYLPKDKPKEQQKPELTESQKEIRERNLKAMNS